LILFWLIFDVYNNIYFYFKLFYKSIIYQISGILDNISEKITEHSELSEFLDAPALFRPEVKKENMPGQVIHYSGEKYLTGIPSQDDIVAENDEGLTAILDDALSSCQEISFMAIDNEESSEKINGKYCYVLRLYGSLINGQKVAVTLFGH
jgi:hypothetical protein